MKLYMFRACSAHRQEFIHCTLGIGICHTGLKKAFEQDQDGTSSILVLVEFHAGVNLGNWCILLVLL